MSAVDIGTVINHQGQRYRCVGFAPHTCRDGREIFLAEWTAPCADCGAPFIHRTPAAASRFAPNRRCSLHR